MGKEMPMDTSQLPGRCEGWFMPIESEQSEYTGRIEPIPLAPLSQVPRLRLAWSREDEEGEVPEGYIFYPEAQTQEENDLLNNLDSLFDDRLNAFLDNYVDKDYVPYQEDGYDDWE